jgi:hypothetical protein
MLKARPTPVLAAVVSSRTTAPMTTRWMLPADDQREGSRVVYRRDAAVGRIDHSVVTSGVGQGETSLR